MIHKIMIFLFSITLFCSLATYAKEKHMQFRVFLDNNEIGTHKVSVIPQSDYKKVKVSADFDVKFLFFSVFNYQHETEELWKDSCLVDIDSKTNNNGENLFIKKVENDGSFKIITHDGKQEIDGCVRSFAYWDPSLLKTQKLLNTQTGEYESVELVNKGRDTIEFEERNIDAYKYRLHVGPKWIDLWYNDDMQWLALKSELENGYTLSYYAKAL